MSFHTRSMMVVMRKELRDFYRDRRTFLMTLLLTPLLSFGLMSVFRVADRGQPPRPGLLFSGFREAGGTAWKPLLLLGVFNALATVAALTLTTAIDGGTLMRIVT